MRCYEFIAGTRPWTDAKREFGGFPKHNDTHSSKYREAIKELQNELSDGEWHVKQVAGRIADDHSVNLQRLCDRAGVYLGEEIVIWIGA